MGRRFPLLVQLEESTVVTVESWKLPLLVRIRGSNSLPRMSMYAKFNVSLFSQSAEDTCYIPEDCVFAGISSNDTCVDYCFSNGYGDAYHKGDDCWCCRR